MPTLVSPGVSVSVIDESFYASSGPGTIPMIFFATRENKTAPNDPNYYAPGSVKENADKLYLITSQRELIQTFGEPTFVTAGGTAVHGDERNEYGLHAAYQYLGIANRAYVIRADVDLGQLDPTNIEPTSAPTNGTYWLDLTNSQFGIFTSNGLGGNNPYANWTVASDVVVVDSLTQAETAIFGSNYVDDINTTAIITDAGDLEINETVVALDASATLEDVVDAINDATITNIEASFDYGAKGVRLKIRNTSAGNINLAGSAAGVLSDLGITDTSVTSDNARPNVGVGNAGSFAVVTLTTNIQIFEKKVAPNDDATAEWYFVGSDDWKSASTSQVVGTESDPTVDGGETLNLTFALDSGNVSTSISFSNGWAVSDVANAIEGNGDLAAFFADGSIAVSVDGDGFLVLENRDGGSITAGGDGATLLGLTSVTGIELYHATHTAIPSNSAAGSVWVKTTEPNNGAKWVVKVYNDEIRQWILIDAPLFANNAAATAAFGTNASAGVVYVQYDPNSEDVGLYNILRWNGSDWVAAVIENSAGSPNTEATEGTTWYSTDIKVDILVGTGQSWQGLQNHAWYTNADIILSGSKPTQKPTGSPGAVAAGSTDLVENDIWIDTSDLENYPMIYRYRTATNKFERVDNTDQTTPNGIVFADARWETATGSQESADLLDSNFVDPDAPDPRTYPNGMLLFNTRYSTLNVKEWKPDYLADYTAAVLADSDLTQYSVGSANFDPIADDATGRWVTISGNQPNGAPWMGRKAQRAIVVRALQAAIAGNEDIRSEAVFFNLIAAPGYPELLDEMVTLNTDKKLTAFIVGDTPARLQATGSAIQNWATNTANAATNGDEGLVTSDTYVGLYYPWGLGTNIDGYEVMIPPSTMALRTLAFNDSVAYPWFAPAGFNRGVVTNAQSVGYLTSEGEFQPVILNQGQRDVIYTNKINPIALMVGQGLTVHGQKTRHPVPSALDRINVVRLVNFLRYTFDVLAKPYLFEPNDQQTRDGIRVTFERALGDLVTLRGLYDFAVVCDESNNTPARIDRNELWVDVAIQPTKALEMIYVPIRILNTGEDMS